MHRTRPLASLAALANAMHDDRVYRERGRERERERDDDIDVDARRSRGDAPRDDRGARKPRPDVSHLTSVKVDNLDYAVTLDDVREAFAEFGAIGDVYMPREHGTGRTRGFGFVRYERREDAEAAVAAMQDVELRGRAIRCAVAERGRGERPAGRYANSNGNSRPYRDGGRDDRRDDRYRRDERSYDDRRYERRYDDRRDDRYDDRGGRSYNDRYDRYDDRRQSYDDRRDTYRDDRRRDGDRRDSRDSYRDDRRRDNAPRHHPYERDSRAPPSSAAEPRDSR